MNYLGDKQSIRRGAQFFYLGIGLGRLVGESLHPELLAMDCCQLLEELEFYFSSSTVQSMKMMVATSSTLHEPLDQENSPQYSADEPFRPTMHKWNNRPVYHRLMTPPIPFPLDYREVLLSLCDILALIYSKLIEDSSASENLNLFQSIIRFDDRIKDKVVVITGGSRGIGKMIADGFVQNGAKVYIASRDVKVCQATADELHAKRPGQCFAADLVSDAACKKKLADEVATKEAKVDVLINNSGIRWGGDVNNQHEKAWSKVLSVNVASPFHLTRYLLPLLDAAAATSAAARVFSIGSVAGLVPQQIDTIVGDTGRKLQLNVQHFEKKEEDEVNKIFLTETRALTFEREVLDKIVCDREENRFELEEKLWQLMVKERGLQEVEDEEDNEGDLDDPVTEEYQETER
ncbi:hypothetical protein PHMEG_00011483 [Phytophthora megakarya]|uniref:Uncharacterized protein n=1 Tax=Phytophthora megakarya TaxID=4795 RepID=A0A225WBF9_9STRA|nr:hypothetical protein PHMEG_00011483 [Phytophthora megakarya]